MRSVSLRLSDLAQSIIPIGWVDENLHTQVRFDSKKIFEQYPDAIPSLAVCPPGGETYPAIVTRDGDYVIWDVTASDVIRYGTGEIQLTFQEGDVVAKTYVCKIRISRSLNPSAVTPEPIENWVTRANVILGEIPQEITRSVGAALQEAKESGEFDGPKGDPGDDGFSPSASVTKAGNKATISITDKTGTSTAEVTDGTDGYTPQRGVDYWTAADQQAMREDIATDLAAAQAAIAGDKADALTAIGSAGTTQVGNVNTAGTTQVGNVNTAGTAQVGAVQAKGAEVIASIPSDYSELSADVSDLKNDFDEITDTETVVGKNIFNPAYLLEVEDWNGSDGEYYGPLNKLATEYASTGYPFTNSFKESTRYTLSFKHKCSTDSAVMVVKFYYTDGINSTVTINRSSDWATGTATSSANKTLSYMYISYSSKGTAVWYLKEIQFEEGTSATTYEEYGTGGTVYTIDPDAIPDGSIGEEKLDFIPPKGQFVSRLAGKKVSIIGDSIDTFDEDGYKISGYRMYYPALGVTDVNDTWWKRVLDASGAVIEVNASWSGSCVTDYASASEYPDFYDRISLIGTPNVIFVTLGTNDSRHSVSLGDYDFETTYTSLSESTFRTAYIKGIKGLKALYPNAEIICMAQQMDDDYRDSIAYIAKNLQCEFLDTSDYVGQDTVHPGVFGMRQLSALVLYATDTELCQSHLPADGKVTGQKISTLERSVTEVSSIIKTAYETGTNVFDPKYLVDNAGWEKTGDVYSGTLTDLIAEYGANVKGYPFRNTFKPNTRYTFSCKGYTLNEKSGTGTGLVVKYIYTDGTSSKSGIDNSTNTFTTFTFTSSANETISEIRFSYGSKPANVWYLKEIQFEEGSSAGTYEAYTETPISVVKASAIEDGSIEKSKLAFDIDDSVIMNADSFPQCSFSFEQAESDITFANGKLLTFGSSSDNHSSYAGIAIYTMDYANKTATKDKTLQHNWGHINSIDYSAGADAFITSNAGQSTTDEGIIYIVENVSDLLALSNNTQIPFATYVKQIDCTGLNFGHKFQLCWGESNGGRHDIVYLLSNDMANIRKLQLGKGSNEFEYGTLISGAESDEFNGTFRVIASYANNLPQQNNGTAYRNGAIWACGTHSGKNIEKMIPQTDGSVYVEKYKETLYGADGSSLSTYGEGIAFDGDYMAYGTGLVVGIYEF